MRQDKLTTKFQQALGEAQSLALAHDNQYIEPVHLLLAVMNDQEGSASSLIERSGGNAKRVRDEAQAAVERLPKVTGTSGDVQVSRDLIRALNLTEKEAMQRGDQFISTEMFLLALAGADMEASRILASAGVTKKLLEAAIEAVRGGESVTDAEGETGRDAIKKYTVDLTERARLGKLDPVIGRDDEIRRTMQILQRRTKNNPVLIGEPGVGKTAVVEGLAQRIVNGEVPDGLKGKAVLSLDMAGLIAGAKYRGEFEERLKKLLKEINRQAEANNRVIKVLLELHIAEEDTKYGLSLDDCRKMLEEGEWRALDHVCICGIMMMASNVDDEGQIRSEFSLAASFFDEVKQKYFADDDRFCERSWGMSHDYHVAVQCRSTMVRVGTAIFGEREY